MVVLLLNPYNTGLIHRLNRLREIPDPKGLLLVVGNALAGAAGPYCTMSADGAGLAIPPVR
jgi:hypothetical protein